ncbi:MAG: carboxylating nicotinate-nucleotide diphosphorylase [Candidatus Acidiferrum sp.]
MTKGLVTSSMDWDSPELHDFILRALQEDVGVGDATALATIPEHARAQARIIARASLVAAGLPLVERVFHALDKNVHVELLCADGDWVETGEPPTTVQALATITGPARVILTGERTALNMLTHLSGIATLTRRFVKELIGTRAKIRDTRKTTPGLRLLEKYAVRMGGGVNYRFGLYDGILLKENHIALAGGVRHALDQAHSYGSLRSAPQELSAYEAGGAEPSASASLAKGASLPIQIEVRDERELQEAMEAGATSVLLDNMTPSQAAACVKLARRLQPSCLIEISGGITLQNVRAYAESGADFLSVGALTHSAPAANLSLLVDGLG